MMTGNTENVMERMLSQVQSNILESNHEEPKIHRGQVCKPVYADPSAMSLL
jgi:hypothetical protein